VTVGDLELAVVVRVGSVEARRLVAAREEVCEDGDAVGDVEDATRVGVAADEELERISRSDAESASSTGR